MNVVVTGSSGFLGRYLCDVLVKAGHKIWGVDLADCLGRTWPMMSMDVTRYVDAPDWLDSFAMEQVDVIYHLAASPWQKTLDGERIRNHAVGALGVCMLAERTKARVVLASSAQVYGAPDVSPQQETHIPRPFEGYGWSKYLAEVVVQNFCNWRRMDYSICRFSNLYGPNQPVGRAITDLTLKFRRAVRDDVDHVELYGTGNETRDWVYVDDVVAALMKLGRVKGSRIFNVGTGRPVAMKDLARMIADRTGYEGAIAFGGKEGLRDSKGEEPRALDITRLAELGWSPAVALEDGLTRTVESIR